MKIDYAWTTRPIIENIVTDAEWYRTWHDGYWRDGVRDALVKNSEKIYERATELQKDLKDIPLLTDKFVAANIDELETSADRNYRNCTELEADIFDFKAESDGIDKV